MSKVSNALRMLILLRSRGRLKTEEIAQLLEVNKRNVSRYRDDLEMAGIYIDSISGRYGGYELESIDYLSSLYLTSEEYNSIFFAVEVLKQYSSPYYTHLRDVFDKITAIKNLDSNDLSKMYYIKNTLSNYDKEREKHFWFDINAAIITSNVIQIDYQKANNEQIIKTVCPYALFQYDGASYFEGYSEDVKDYRIFKLSRIKKLFTISRKFIRKTNYNLKERMHDCFGIYKDEEVFLKLKIYYPMAQVVKEKIWVDNQCITESKEENYIIFEAKMRGKTQIKSWILSMGKDAEIIQPESLKAEIVEEVDKMYSLYK